MDTPKTGAAGAKSSERFTVQKGPIDLPYHGSSLPAGDGVTYRNGLAHITQGSVVPIEVWSGLTQQQRDELTQNGTVTPQAG